MRRLLQSTLRGAGIVVTIAALTDVCYRIVPVNSSTAGFAYLLAVLLIATFRGLSESLVASVAAVLCFNYFFLPPILHFTIADPQNWVALFSFFTVAVLVSKLSDDARRQTESADDRRLEMERLYTFSRAVLLIESHHEISQAARQIAQIFGVSALSLYDRLTGEIHRAGEQDIPEWDDRLREVAVQGSMVVDPEKQMLVTAIRLGAEPIGSVALRGVHLSDSALQSLVNLVAIVIERARTLDRANRADVARQSQELKSTLLDAIAHEFKTPLTSIKAAASALRSENTVPPDAQKELAAIVEEESDRLGRLVTEAIQMARIEAGRVHLHKDAHSLRGLVERTVAAMGALLQDREVRLDIAENLPPVEVDGELIEMALRQILDNAAKYSTPGTPLVIHGDERQGRVCVGIWNEGPDIPENEQSPIFDKFYRVPGASRAIPGTGMGLAIARDIVQAHKGHIWVESGPGRGVELCISLTPALQEALV